MKIRSKLSKKALFGIFALVIAGTLITSAGLLTFYGKVETTANVKQSVVLWDINNDDWKEDNSLVIKTFGTEENPLYGGCCETFKHKIKNRGCVEAPIDITTTVNGHGKGKGGVNTTVYDLSSKLFVSDEVTGQSGTTYNTTDYYDNNLLVEINHYENCDIEFVVTTPKPLYDESHDNFAAGFDKDNDGEADFQVSFHSDKDHSGNYWRYQAVEDGSWGDWQTLPSWIDADNEGRHVFTISFSSDVLGGIGSVYKFGVSGSLTGGDNPAGYDNGITGESHVYFQYPLDFSWGTAPYTSSGTYKWQQVGTELNSPFPLQAGEEMIFAMQYCFDIAIKPGEYTITTEFSPETD